MHYTKHIKPTSSVNDDEHHFLFKCHTCWWLKHDKSDTGTLVYKGLIKIVVGPLIIQLSKITLNFDTVNIYIAGELFGLVL